MNEKTDIEPGLLRIFRLLIILRIGLTLLKWALPGPLPSTDSLEATIMELLDALVVIVILCWPRMRKWLGKAYLPVALTVASLGPILTLHVRQWLLGTDTLNATVDARLLYGTLIVPLVLIAWQYRFREVLWFSAATMILDLALMPVTSNVPTTQYVSYGWAVVSRTTTCITTGFVVSLLMRNQREQRTALQDANTRLAQHAATVEQLTVSRERNRLARDLHATLAHTLTALAVQLEAADVLLEDKPQEARALLAKSLTTTRTGLKNTRSALHDLRSEPLEDLGLELTLRDLIETVMARSSVETQLHFPSYTQDMPAYADQCVYRVVQEALENVVRHAAATLVSVTLTYENRTCRVIITDDGQGFDVQAVDTNTHFGIRGMFERVEMVEGSLSVISRPGKGTTIELEIPIENS